LAANSARTQVVKYHGDLQHEDTLVLTESAYFRRLDFESPMDLKFRGDLLGKSVLFMGYSFRDVNIRLIWFKLMQMMQDIPAADRVRSYIVRMQSNPALEALDRGVGLETIVLSPGRAATDGAERVRLLSNFLMNLSLRAHPRRRTRRIFVSDALLDEVAREVASLGTYGGRIGSLDPWFKSHSMAWGRLDSAVVPPLLRERADKRRLTMMNLTLSDARSYASVLREVEPSTELTRQVVRLLAANQSRKAREIREPLAQEAGIWPKIWAHKIPIEDGQHIIAQLYEELAYQATRGADGDIVFLAELCKRIADGLLVERASKEFRAIATGLLREISRMYPSAADLKPTRQAPPDVTRLMAEVAKRREDFSPVALELPSPPDFLQDDRRERFDAFNRIVLSRSRLEPQTEAPLASDLSPASGDASALTPGLEVP